MTSAIFHIYIFFFYGHSQLYFWVLGWHQWHSFDTDEPVMLLISAVTPVTFSWHWQASYAVNFRGDVLLAVFHQHRDPRHFARPVQEGGGSGPHLQNFSRCFRRLLCKSVTLLIFSVIAGWWFTGWLVGWGAIVEQSCSVLELDFKANGFAGHLFSVF